MQEPARGERTEQSLVLKGAHITVTVVIGKNAQGLLSRFFLELLSAFGHTSLGL